MDVDALVIGAGFGGLGAAVTRSAAGERVVLCEALTYPGGCASTFTKHGDQFESGATLASGLAPGQLFDRWLDRAGVTVDHEPLDPAMVVRTPGWELPIDGDRAAFIERLCALPDAPVRGIREFFGLQQRVAETLWPLLDDPLRTLPHRSLVFHLQRSLGYLPLLGLLGRPLTQVMERFGVASFEPLRVAMDSLCQITVQCMAHEAEAPFALSAIDYGFRGAAHVDGGMGALASALCEVVRKQGGEVRFASRVKELRREGAHWVAETRTGRLRARRVYANLLPGDLNDLAGLQSSSLRRRQERVEQGWGAVMRYGRVTHGVLDCPSAYHLELVGQPGEPLHSGNHVFLSVGPETAEGRSITASTHTRIDDTPAQTTDLVQEQLGRTLASCAPELDCVQWMTGSPRTFQRFTRRSRGWVGGIPRRAGLGQYLDIGVPQPATGLYLVGDSVFPGQSALAAALGGARAASQG